MKVLRILAVLSVNRLVMAQHQAATNISVSTLPAPHATTSGGSVNAVEQIEEKTQNDRSLPPRKLSTNLAQLLANRPNLSKVFKVNTSPMADTHGIYRMGQLRHTAIPNTWGAKPYPLGYSNAGPFVNSLPPSLGTLLTDGTAAGNKIRKQLLDAHNYVRQVEAPLATYMLKVTWDFHLEAYATQWAQLLCTANQRKYFEHSPLAGGFPEWPWRIAPGENLYTTTGLRRHTDDYSEVVYKWYNEREYYNWETGKATPPATGPVGHYTQLVRQDMSAVGCAVITGCKSVGDWRTFVVCHYDWGNAGKEPYQRRTTNSKGYTCDNCPAGFDCCEINLCAGRFHTPNLSGFGPAKIYKKEWYGCSNHRRGCSNTGALTADITLKHDPYGLEFQTCHCGLGSGYDQLYDTVRRGVFWYRDRCYKLNRGGTGRALVSVGKCGNGTDVECEDGELDEAIEHSKMFRKHLAVENAVKGIFHSNSTILPPPGSHTFIRPQAMATGGHVIPTLEEVAFQVDAANVGEMESVL